MNAASVAIVGKPNDAHRLAEEGARIAFSPVSVSDFEDVTQLSRSVGRAFDIVVLVEPSSEAIREVATATDATKLPRWSLVVLGAGNGTTEAEFIHPSDWDKNLIAKVLRGAKTQLVLRRENVRAKGDFCTIGRRINHDLRTPLGCIVSTAEALKEMMPPDAPGSALLTSQILDSVDQLLRLLERVSLLAKASSGSALCGPVSMEMVLWSTLQRLERQLLRVGATVSQPTHWPEVNGIAEWLEVVWQNLLLNSLQHGGESLRIEVGWDSAPDEIRFWIRDNGPGVPAEKQPLLFEPFHVLSKADAGQGLGLAIVQRLVDLQGGRCGYESLPDHGSLFYFTLPPVQPA